MKEAFVSLVGSGIITFFFMTFLYIFEVFNEKTELRFKIGITLLFNAMFFTIIFFIVHFKTFG